MSSDAPSGGPEPQRPAVAPATYAVPPQLPAGAYPRQPKTPGLALFLSFVFPGSGQLYNGQAAKGFAFFFGLVASIYLAAEVDPMPFALMIPFVVIYNLIDAWKSATLINARAAGGLVVEDEDDFESPAWGAALVGLGVLLLLNNLGWLDVTALRRYWPVLLIGVGGWFLYRSVRRQDTPESHDPDQA